MKFIVGKCRNTKSSKEGKDKDDEIKCKITLYQNGFTIDEGEFRDYATPENKQFMKELNQQ